MKRFAVVLMLLIFAVQIAVGQSLVSGDISGTVTDPTGAVIANATISVKNLDTGSSQTSTTNAAGVFRFSLLKPGRYTLIAKHAGFRPAERTIAVSVGQTATVDVALPVGTTTETVEVSGEASMVNAETATVSTAFNPAELANLPNAGGDLTNIAQNAPGVTMNTSGGYGNFTANGMPATSNLFTVNGENNMDPFFNINNSGATNLTLGMNEIQEATVVTNPYSGQYGQQAGAQVNYITKSGTNRFHGDADYKWNGRVMNANDWFANNNGDKRPFANANQYAVDFGGPIKKDKTFFYVNYEGLRYVLPTAATTYVPTANFMAASLAYVAANQPNSLSLYQKMFDVYKGAPSSTAQPVAGSCGDIIRSGASRLTGINVGDACSAKYIATPNQLSWEWILAGRVDHNFSDNDRVFVRYRMDRGLQATGTDPINPAFNETSFQPSYDGQAQWNHTFGPTATNQFIVAGSYYRAMFNDDPGATGVFPYSVDFSGPLMSHIGPHTNMPQGRNITQYQFIDDFTKVVGNHTLKFGANFRRYDVSDFNFSYQNPAAVFNSMYGFATGTSYYTRQYFPTKKAVPVAMYGLGLYGEDEWRVSSKLKLTLALRAERNGNPTCGVNCFSRFKGDWNSLQHGPDVPYTTNIQYGLNTAYPGVDALNLSPRLGFIYSPDAKTVISGGAGIFYDAMSQGIMEAAFTGMPFVSPLTANSSLWADPSAAGAASILAASNTALRAGFIAGQSYNQIRAVVPLFSAPSFSNYVGTMHTPQFQQWDLQIQRQLTDNMTLTLNYTGNHGIHMLYRSNWMNAYDGYGIGVVGVPATAPDRSYGTVTQYYTGAIANYNGLNASLSRRFSHGLSFLANYTWSHGFDEVSNGGRYFYGNDSLTFQLNPTSLRANNYGNSDYDIRHNFNANFVWEPPYKFNNAVVNHLVGGWTFSSQFFARTGLPYTIVDYDAPMRNGQAYLPAQPRGNAATFGATGSCNNPLNACFSDSSFYYSDSPDFTGYATFPSGRRNQYRGPGFFDTNFSVLKNVRIQEKATFSFGATFYNLFNHPNFANPNWALVGGDSTVGFIQSTVATPASPYGSFVGAAASGRLVQFHARLKF